MAEQPIPHDDSKTRANLAYIWSFAIIAMVTYTLIMYGSILAVLTLIIGFVTGTAATILAVYFGAPIGAKKPIDAGGGAPSVTGDNPQVTVNNNTPTE